MAHVDKAPSELEAGHGRHVDVGNQAGRFGEERGRQEFGSRREIVDRIPERSDEPAHGFTKKPVIIDDRNQYLLHHLAYELIRSTRRAGGPKVPQLQVGLLDFRQECHRCSADAP